ncbi:MAG TPA: HAD-IA family hydrolase [Burkholderiales bacterium]|jgi:2-haloacid dehalogenase|nr:HAD-IA family hydrolase [Burkholderiales bacterium]
MISARRRFCLHLSTLAIAGAWLSVSRPVLAESPGGKFGVKALIFDVFGTLVDWRTGVAREARALLEPLGYKLDWLAFADAWRAEYQPGMEEVRSGRVPFSRLDVIHRRMLERIRPRFGLEKVEEPVLRELNMAWHKLDAWPGVSAALKRLRSRYLLAPCSNGNISLMVDLARRNDFHWDAILGAEIAGDYKPKLRVYQVSAEALGIEHHECMMVAAHSDDLKFAAQAGLRTGFVSSPDEFGPNTGELEPKVPVDVSARTFTEFAGKMLA